MTTLNPYGYNRSYYTETTGSWVAPSTCFKALVIIGGGGGGGGGGSGAGGSPLSNSSAGGTGGNGGNTTFVGPNGVSLTSLGGNGGTGGPAVGTSTPGNPGVGGANSGNVSRNFGGQVANSTGIPVEGSQQTQQQSLYENSFLMGGKGGGASTLRCVAFTAPATYSQEAGYISGTPGQGVNAGATAAGGNLSSNNALTTRAGGGGGFGGNSIGEKYPVKIAPGATYTITIGSGGAGGAGGNCGSAPTVNGTGGGAGGGGASGFCYILWNDILQGT